MGELGPGVPDFEDFYADHYPRVREYAARQFGADEADDIAQETLIRALRQFDRLTDGRPAGPWLTTVARRIGIDNLRRRKPEVVDDDMLDALSPAVPDEAADIARRVDLGDLFDRAMNRLSTLDRQVLTLHEVEDLDLGEIASRTGTTANTVRQRLFRARRNLGRRYRELGGGQYSLPTPTGPAATGHRPRARVLREPVRSVGDALRRHLPAPTQPGRTASVAAIIATSGALIAVPPITSSSRPPRPAPPRVPVVVPPADLPASPEGQLALPAVSELTDRLARTSGRRPAATLRLPFTEEWESGLDGWTVTGTQAAPDCITRLRGKCSLALAPDGSVAVARPVNATLGPQIQLVFQLLGAPAGHTEFALRLALDTVTVSLDVIRRSDTAEVRLHSSASADVATFSVPPDLWQAFWLRLDSRTDEVVAGVGMLGGGARLPLPPNARRLHGIGIGATHVSGASGRFWFDSLSIDRDLQCTDGLDNDGDGDIDGADIGCLNHEDRTESPDPECSDGEDNDGDGKTDFPGDPSCPHPRADSETALCSNGLDDDHDGAADYPADPDCGSELDEGEQARCSNGKDDDRDGSTDFPEELGCTSSDDDTEWSCLATRVDARGVPVVESQQSRPFFTGPCFDPVEEVGELAFVRQADVQDVRGYLDEYEFVLPEVGTRSLLCVVLIDDRATPDACAAVGGTFVRRVASLIRLEAAGAETGLAHRVGVCTAAVNVVLRNDQYVDPANRHPLALTLCRSGRR